MLIDWMILVGEVIFIVWIWSSNEFVGYLDFGEVCADKILQFCHYTKDEIQKETSKQQSYSDYERYRSNQQHNHYNDRDYH